MIFVVFDPLDEVRVLLFSENLLVNGLGRLGLLFEVFDEIVNPDVDLLVLGAVEIALVRALLAN